LKKFPKLKCVVAHLGCFEEELFLEACLHYENLYLDTSYTFIANPTNIMTAPVELVKKAYQKIFFGSDFPGICHSYDKSIEAIANLPLTEEEKNSIFFKNADNFLKNIGANKQSKEL
jgi:predicted TIM-barrel fold metal-dependent hydrolase